MNINAQEHDSILISHPFLSGHIFRLVNPPFGSKICKLAFSQFALPLVIVKPSSLINIWSCGSGKYIFHIWFLLSPLKKLFWKPQNIKKRHLRLFYGMDAYLNRICSNSDYQTISCLLKQIKWIWIIYIKGSYISNTLLEPKISK